MVATWRKNDATTAVGNPEEKSGSLVVILSVNVVPRGATDNSNKENKTKVISCCLVYPVKADSKRG